METQSPVYHDPQWYLANYEYDDSILTAIGNLLNHYTEKHGKTLVVRFDLRYPQAYSREITNQDVSRCMAKIVQRYKRQGYDPYYIWVREQVGSNHPHYHCCLFLNGNRVRSYNHVFQTAESLWGSTLNLPAVGLVHHCTTNSQGIPHENGILLRRSDENCQARFEDVQRQTSYMAKAEGKASPKDGLRNFGMSRIPSK